jgi:hypothetical protein
MEYLIVIATVVLCGTIATVGASIVSAIRTLKPFQSPGDQEAIDKINAIDSAMKARTDNMKTALKQEKK